MAHSKPTNAETQRLREDAARAKNWKRWGPYLSERQWGTVREDYSSDGSAWDYFPHDHARSRAYRWGEDGLLGITDRECRLCFALALWNGRDAILKERIFGLSGTEGNHGEDCKDLYYYLASTPTHSYMKALYKYPQRAFPYGELVAENRRRGIEAAEYELLETGVFESNRYFDVQIEYAKATEDDICVRLHIANRGPEAAVIHVLPTLWFRNTWSWGREGQDGYWPRPNLVATDTTTITATHETLGRYQLRCSPTELSELLFTENETNFERLFGTRNPTPHVKDAFHEYLIEHRTDAVNSARTGTKAAAHYQFAIPAGGAKQIQLRLSVAAAKAEPAFGRAFDEVFAARARECADFYRAVAPTLTPAEREVVDQGYAGLLWSKQYYHYAVKDWLAEDPAYPPRISPRADGRNADWKHLYNRDVISMPDKWEYPWYAAWDLAFHMLPFARIDAEFAKQQLLLFLREWYMHPNGQIPAYEWALGDVNPPVHAWAVWRVYKISGRRDERDLLFLKRAFTKLLINFTWWVNRKDLEGRHLFAGGFLGLDNIGVFDRSQPLPDRGHLDQADGTAWMAFYCATMLSIALELAQADQAYEDIASKFLEHFVAIADAMNSLGGTGLWDDKDGLYYDQLHLHGERQPLRVRSLVGLIPLLAVEIIENDVLERLPGFTRRMNWFLENRSDLSHQISYMCGECGVEHGHRLLAIPSRERLERLLQVMLDESEFLSPHGIRSVSRYHREHPYSIQAGGSEHRVDYSPAESRTRLFGGNSNWRGPVWFPINYLLLEALEKYHHFYGDSFKVECPTGSGRWLNLEQVANEISRRLSAIFLQDENGRRPCHGSEGCYTSDPHWRDLILFHEHFDGDDGHGLGATHQTGWTALVVRCIESLAQQRGRERKRESATVNS
ncbi:MAG: MGH1-like glycoside hydrolase domain-containing protein [Planctomycetota bacterium]